MRVVVYQEKKKFQREIEREYHINLSTPMNLYNMYILPIQIHMPKLQLGKEKNKNMGCKRNSMERLNIYIYIYIFIYKF